MRKITVPAGIGDGIWILMKLINSGEKFDFILPDGKPQRGAQIFNLLPEVVNSVVYAPKLTYKKIDKENIQRSCSNFSDIKLKEFTLSMNRHLENGHRIETFLPDLETTFRIKWSTSSEYDQVNKDLPEGKTYIGIYGSAYSTSRAWGFWDENGWLELIKLNHIINPHHVYVIIGAEWDLDLGINLMKLLSDEKIPFVNTIGKSLAYVIEVMKILHYFFSFPSGLGILAPTVGCSVTMFYPKQLEKMMNTWANPEDIELGHYKGCQFCTPVQIYDWCIKNDKI